jgi:adenylate cyclase
MASLIPGYEYDIFISYRQKDNKYDGWVTEFVDNLRKELEATFKEDISVYFDINPHDGLLITHEVNESLKEKLRCLVFIPIISRTYCDPKSFAWEHEFKAFVEQASLDQFGLKIKLLNGNVASRVLPVRIYDLDDADLKLCESVLGGVLRGVEFIYAEPGVNRPLKPRDNEGKYINNANYRNQINKVSNAIKEIFSGLKTGPVSTTSEREDTDSDIAIPSGQGKSIAVLPFVDMSPEKDQSYFCDGITEEIINALAHVEGFKVIARTSAFAFKDKLTDIREIGRILDVETVLEGSIRKADNKLRITAQLIKVTDGSHIWSERFDRDMNDVFAIQDEISLAILKILKIKLLGEVKALITKRHTENFEAFNLYLKGTHCWQMMTNEGFRKALNYFEQALKIDPDYALAYTGLAHANIHIPAYGNETPNNAYPRAIEYLDKALKIDNTLAEIYAGLGLIYTFYNWNRKEAEENFKHALRINPNSSIIHIDYSHLLSFMGRHEEAISEAKLAQKFDPLSCFINTQTGDSYALASQYDKAIEELRMTLTIYPNYFMAHGSLGNVYVAKEMWNEAIYEFQKTVELSYGSPMATATLIYCYYLAGKKVEADKLFESFKNRAESEYVPATCFYMIHRVRGEEDLALDWLKRACNEHDTVLPFFLKDTPVLIPKGSVYMSLVKDMGVLQ